MDAFWVFQIPNLILAAIMYTLLGRFLLSLFFAPNSDKVLWRVFVQVTDPFVNAVRFVTPQLVPFNLVVLFAALWTLLARIGLFFAVAAGGLAPSVGA
jgi:YggT family protein